jgi:hypothetical protein
MDRRVSSRRARVIIEEPAQPLATANPIDTIDRWCAVDELIAQALVIPFTMVMRDDRIATSRTSTCARSAADATAESCRA